MNKELKILILGKGKVSNIIKKNGDIVLSKKECNISDYGNSFDTIKTVSPDIIINCAAKTNLEYCQIEKLETFKSNTLGVMNLINICSDLNKKLVHISSGCLFDGNDFISSEETLPSPAVWYTWTKKWADEIIQNHGYSNYLILRPRQLISRVPHKSNMITKFSKMVHLPAIDEPNSLTCIEDFSEMINHLLLNKLTGVFNCCNTGVVSPYTIALMIKKYINPGLNVSKVQYNDLLSMLPNRRVNTILSCEKLIKTGYKPRSAISALEWCVKGYST